MRNPKQQKRAPIGAQFKAKKIITTRENGSLRVQKDFSDCVSKTKLEFQKECDIQHRQIPSTTSSTSCLL